MSQEKAQLIAPIGIMTVSGMTATGVITATSFTGNIVGSAKSLVNGTDVTAGVVTGTSFVGNLTGNIQRLADSTHTSTHFQTYPNELTSNHQAHQF